MQKKFRRSWVVLLLPVCAALLAVLLMLRAGRAQPAAPRYMLRDNGGHPALYTADGAGPLAQYDEIYTRLLPESDYLNLQQGILLADEAELQARLEDLGL